ncbi:MAG: hypothetical protein AAF694_10215 [Bacteroidota bacterium]
MRHLIGFFLIGVCWQAAYGHSDSIKVYIFLGEECVISQYYTLPLKTLHEEYENKGIDFVGLFPSPGSDTASRQSFQNKYQLPFELQKDTAQAWMHHFGVRVTPEVVVVEESSGKILYQGRIDDTYFQVGRRRPVTRNHELSDALQAISMGKEVPVDRTEAVGCIITRVGEKPAIHSH